jgi:hypothetical protein
MLHPISSIRRHQCLWENVFLVVEITRGWIASSAMLNALAVVEMGM